MKILWSTPWFGNYRIPVYDYLNKMTDGNFYLVCSEGDTSDLVREKLYDTLGDHVKVLTGEKRITLGKQGTTFANKTLVLKSQPGLYDAIKKVNPDVVIVEGFGSWAPVGIGYAKINKKKLCMFYERTKYVERNSPAFRTWYRKLVGQAVDHFLVNGTLTEEYLRDSLGFKKTPITKGCMCADSFGLANAVRNVTAEQKIELANNLGLNKDGLIFLFVGQMVERKGIKELLTAWKEHLKNYPNDNIIVIGKGHLEDGLKNKYMNISSVHIMGGISYDELHRYYALCDVFIMPTLEDNWCLVIPEAMACGKPVACSIYNGGHLELVKDGEDGYNFNPLKEESIVEVLSKFHDADLKAMGKRAVEIESNYTPDKSARRIYNACKSALEHDNRL